MMRVNKGFTLVEMLVVIGIIGILIVALVPVVKNAQTRAKEMAVKTHCADIEAALANYAQNHNGNYPGVASDPMASWADHSLGDATNYGGSIMYTRTPPGSNQDGFDSTPGYLVGGLLGGFGHDNAEFLSGTGVPQLFNVFEQVKYTKDSLLDGSDGRLGAGMPRYFDSLMLTDSIQEYPQNPFITSTSGLGANERARMTNIFRFWIDVANMSPDFTNSNAYGVAILTQNGAVPPGWTLERESITDRLLDNYLPLLPASYAARDYSLRCAFGNGTYDLNNTPNDVTDDVDDLFAPGDFAYVPVLTSSAQPFGDAAATLENEYYRWGVNVGGYLLFGYGSGNSGAANFEDEARDYFNTGLPGYGSTGIDTNYEAAVLQLFEGAVYFSKKY